jgi:hypothetical protein
MRHGRIADDLDPIGEFHTLDQFWQLVVAVDPAPTFLRTLDKLENHGEGGLVRQAAPLTGWCGVERSQRCFKLDSSSVSASNARQGSRRTPIAHRDP